MRIAILLIAATATSLGNYLITATALVGVAFCYWRYANFNLQPGLRLLSRMRWFFLSIIIVYFWFTPGHVLFSVDHVSSWWLPTYEGIALGLHRVLILALIIFMVNLLLLITPAPRLLMAIYWWVRPLCFIGVDTAKFALRINLVFTFVPQAHELINEVKERAFANNVQHLSEIEYACAPKRSPSRTGIAGGDSKRPSSLGKKVAVQWGGALRFLGKAIGEAMLAAEQRADTQILEPVTLPVADVPPHWQWLLPAALMALAILLQYTPSLVQA